MDLKRLYIKWRYWEFWPTWLVYLPVLLCYPFWALRCRTWFWYASVNPGLEMGGLYGTSKHGALKYLPATARPITLLFEPGVSKDDVLRSMQEHRISLPVVVKPDYGERGQGVDLIYTEDQLAHSIATQSSAFILQPYLDLPFEAGVFFVRQQGESKGRVPSIVVKGFLTITGDGRSTVEELALGNKRAYLIWPTLQHNLDIPRDKVLAIGEEVILEPIGNHSRGTAFNDGNGNWTEALVAWANDMADAIPDFYYGRFDVRAPSEEAFRAAEGIQVLEVNGANAEPAHIYQEGASLWKGWATLIAYWNAMSLIAKVNRRNGHGVDFDTAYHYYKQWKSIKKDKWNRSHAAS